MHRHLGRAARCGLTWLACAGLWADPGNAATAETAKPAVPPLLPAEDFARPPQFTDAKLSPNGAAIGYLAQREDNTGLGILDLASMKPDVMWAHRPYSFRFKNDVTGFDWVSDDRLVLHSTLGLAGVNRDLTHFTYLSGAGRWDEERSAQRNGARSNPSDFDAAGIVYSSQHDARSILVTTYPKQSGEEAVCPDVYQLNTENGAYHLVLENPGGVKAWLADWDGAVRFGLLGDGITSQLIHRAGTGAAWSRPLAFGRNTLQYGLAGLDADGRTLYVFKATPSGRRALYAYDLQEGRFGEPLFQHQKYDVGGAVFSPKHRRLLGVRYQTEGPRQFWFEPDLAALQKELDAAHPGLVNEIVSMDWEMQKMLVHTYSTRDPGYYTLLDLRTHKTIPIAPVRPWIKPEQMADKFPVKCQARDGLELNGYLTLPPGRSQKNLPMVTLVHGGPYGVRDTWGFDPLVQFLANRGYAVLQVNYRGSGGYGEEFYLKGKGQIGGALEDDVEDMTRWAVKAGVADAHRLAIMGASYGGYSTLVALARSPDLFRCGVACMAVTNWGSLYQDLEREQFTDALRWWRAMIGDMKDEKERQRLTAVSPVNFVERIRTPLFIMHGEEDRTVPVEQARALVAALKRVGRPPETQFFEETGHWWPRDKKGVEFLTKLEQFLAAHLKAE